MFSLLFLSSLSVVPLTLSQCPCSDSSLCNPITSIPDKELFGFATTDPTFVPYYNWTYITSIAFRETNDSTIMCEAHKNNARAILWSSGDPLTPNVTQRQEWIIEQYNIVKNNFLDGITFDYEFKMNSDDVRNEYYIQLINETKTYFNQNLGYTAQISVCVPWIVGSDGRYYHYEKMAEISDFLYVMDYDTQSQIMDACIAGANSPITKTMIGLESYLNLGINASSLVLGIPWYGYNFTCDMSELESKTSKYCPLESRPYRGINCSDSIGNELGYAKVFYYVLDKGYNITNIRWNNNMKAPYFNYMLPYVPNTNQVFQIWFDNVLSLQNKYTMARQYGLRGVGPFRFDEIYWNFTAQELKRAQQIWKAFDTFFI